MTRMIEAERNFEEFWRELGSLLVSARSGEDLFNHTGTVTACLISRRQPEYAGKITAITCATRSPGPLSS